MPTRRVAVERAHLPTSGPAYGAVLLGAVVAEHLGALDEEQLDALGRLVDVAKRGALDVPRIALRYRLQTDVHGLELSRHRILAADPFAGRNLPVLELDRHGRAVPQLIGAVMAAAMLPPSADDAFRCGVGDQPAGVMPRARDPAPDAVPPWPAAAARRAPAAGRGGRRTLAGVPADRRWAMELGFAHAGRRPV
jgi:hypothetical protein